MHNYKKLFDTTTAYWIYGYQERTKEEVKQILVDMIIHRSNEPNQILVDMVRSLQKLEEMSENDYISNNKLFPFHEEIEKEMDQYSDYIHLARKDFWKNGYQEYSYHENW